jgi:hypothetical protein
MILEIFVYQKCEPFTMTVSSLFIEENMTRKYLKPPHSSLREVVGGFPPYPPCLKGGYGWLLPSSAFLWQ